VVFLSKLQILPDKGIDLARLVACDALLPVAIGGFIALLQVCLDAICQRIRRAFLKQRQKSKDRKAKTDWHRQPQRQGRVP
jgi:hypothetical protein